MSSKSVSRLLRISVGIAFVFATALVINCGSNGTQNISPYGGYGITSCVPGQVGCTSTCVPGQVGCTGGGYILYAGYIGSLNNSLVNQILLNMYGIQNYCLGGCYNGSSVQLTITGGTQASLSLYFGGYAVSGYGTVSPINNNVGSLVQVEVFRVERFPLHPTTFR